MATPELLFPPLAFAGPSISVRDRDCTAGQEQYRYNYSEIKVLLLRQCASCMFLHRPGWLLRN
jgi:hypothetical protein